MLSIESPAPLGKHFYGFWTENTQYMVKKSDSTSELAQLQHIGDVVKRMIAAMLSELEQQSTDEELEHASGQT